jgi:hypothetical protein
MKPATLLRIEWIKTSRRKAFWVGLAFLTLMCGLVLGGQFVQGRLGDGAPLVAPFAWAMAASELDGMPAFFLALTVVMLVTSEFTWRTARQNVIDGLSREQFFVAKTLNLLLVLAIFMVVPFTIATGFAVYGRLAGATPAELGRPARDATPSRDRSGAPRAGESRADSTSRTGASQMTAEDSVRAAARQRVDSAQAALRQAMRDLATQRPRPVFPAPDRTASFLTLDDLKVAGAFTLGSLGFASMAFMLAIGLRSTGGAIGVFFMYFAFLEQLLVLMLRRFGSAELARDVAPYLPANALRAPTNPMLWHSEFVERANAIAASIGQPAAAVEPDPWRLVGVASLWIVAFITVAFLAFRRRDL